MPAIEHVIRPLRLVTRGQLAAQGDAAFGEVVGGHLYQNLVARQHPNPVLAHLAGRMGDDLVLVLEFDAEGGVGQQLYDRARELE